MRQNASERRGTHMTKNRALVSGSGKKPYKQKGTGRPQVGSIAHAALAARRHGVRPAAAQLRLRAAEEGRARRAARGAGGQAAATARSIVVDELAATEKKTKPAAELLKRLGATRPDARRRRGARRELQRCRRATSPACGSCASGRLTARDVMDTDAHHRDARRGRAAAGGAGMKTTDVIRRPLVTEKTTIARETARRSSCSKWRATRPRSTCKRAVEKLFGVEGRVGAHADRARQVQAPGPVRGPAVGLEEGLGPAEGRREGAGVHRRHVETRDRIMPIRNYKPTSAGRRFQSVQTFDEITTVDGRTSRWSRRSSDRAAATTSGELTSWWRGGGHKRNYRIIDFKRDKFNIPGKVSTVEYDPNRIGAHRARDLRRRREALHPASARPQGRRPGDVGRERATSCRATACRSRTSRSAR